MTPRHIAIGALAGLALAWSLALSLPATTRADIAPPIPARELAAINAQARTLCGRHRAGAPTTITLPDGVLTCPSRRPS